MVDGKLVKLLVFLRKLDTILLNIKFLNFSLKLWNLWKIDNISDKGNVTHNGWFVDH